MFLAWKKSENESKNGSKITKKRFRATPHQRVEKNTLQTQKMNPKSWKTRGFFTFFSGQVWRAKQRTSLFRTVFYSVLWRRASRPIKNRRFFPNKGPPPPQVNLNLSWLMPSGWSRPLHLRCGRIWWELLWFPLQIFPTKPIHFLRRPRPIAVNFASNSLGRCRCAGTIGRRPVVGL